MPQSEKQPPQQKTTHSPDEKTIPQPQPLQQNIPQQQTQQQPQQDPPDPNQHPPWSKTPPEALHRREKSIELPPESLIQLTTQLNEPTQTLQKPSQAEPKLLQQLDEKKTDTQNIPTQSEKTPGPLQRQDKSIEDLPVTRLNAQLQAQTQPTQETSQQLPKQSRDEQILTEQPPSGPQETLEPAVPQHQQSQEEKKNIVNPQKPSTPPKKILEPLLQRQNKSIVDPPENQLSTQLQIPTQSTHKTPQENKLDHQKVSTQPEKTPQVEKNLTQQSEHLPDRENTNIESQKLATPPLDEPPSTQQHQNQQNSSATPSPRSSPQHHPPQQTDQKRHHHQRTGSSSHKKMASPSFEYFRSSFDNVFQILPQGHEKALKKALYNTAANFFVIFASLVVVAVYFVLQAFLRPLLWAVLCGTFLYPFKRTLTSGLRSWLQGLDQSGTPFAAGLVLLPLQSVHDASEMISTTLKNHLKLILVGTVGLPCLNLLYYFGLTDTIFSWIYSSFVFLYAALDYFSSVWVWTLVVAYIIMVVLYWRPDNNKQIQYLSIPVWIIVVLHICSRAGSLGVPILIITTIMMLVGYISETKKPVTDDGTVSEKDPGDSPVYAALALLTTPKSTPTLTRRTPLEEGSPNAIKGDESAGVSPAQSFGGGNKDGEAKVKALPLQTKPQGPNSQHKPKSKPKDKHQRSLSDQCFIALFWAFVLVRLWIHAWVLLLIPIPIVLIILKRIWRRFNLGFGPLTNYCKAWVDARKDVLFPTPVRGFIKLCTTADRKLISILEQSLDSATSVLFILILLFGTALFTFFFVFQVHQESMHLVQVTSNVLNKSVNPEISQWIPNGDAMQKAMDSMMANAYLYGRDWIASKIRDAVQGRGGNTSNIEKEVLEVWDRLYKSWFARNTTASLVDKPENMVGGSNLTALWGLASKRNGFVVTDVMHFAKSNIGTLMSVMDSIWLVLKGNVSLAFSFLTAVLSLLFGGGTALLNFIISAAIFLTTLFYLLASSGEQYKPVEWFTAFAPMTGGSGNSIGHAVEDAVSGVFMASLKMAAFYGLYTWLTHTIFSVNIVFIPSALAAVFGAIPFLGTYWAVIPAVLELWLVNREGLQAILIIVAHLLPTYVVDTAIYSEIKGGHPYMTGLSIAGGIYCLGLEGALIGPIVLCFLMAAISIYGNLLRGGGSEPNSTNSRPGEDPCPSEPQH